MWQLRKANPDTAYPLGISREGLKLAPQQDDVARNIARISREGLKLHLEEREGIGHSHVGESQEKD